MEASPINQDNQNYKNTFLDNLIVQYMETPPNGILISQIGG